MAKPTIERLRAGPWRSRHEGGRGVYRHVRVLTLAAALHLCAVLAIPDDNEWIIRIGGEAN